ncbi:hypothetical protein SLNWT_2832 [Streptomyces albus]|uniref:Uncharacterized protein n=1 Tax=Streptomyces albus (strain ATCC 21838 / DSM 41398 / FERM P-419 / JCM 4703 / NBRC 107858) TaxID=1081613 RepID=A0A0B5ELD3_STRA4|nr:hypothetical protein SLNWT_2832 [Streptomyces albus]AOU77521.1 hypothetical protein SLNHY_2830 [Streptomyces albus]AYN33290.1 hypothetical protein DUI70_2791 [Streptomyces albus]
MHDAHPARSQAALQAVLTGVLGIRRVGTGTDASPWRHGPTPEAVRPARDARSLVDASSPAAGAC